MIGYLLVILTIAATLFDPSLVQLVCTHCDKLDVELCLFIIDYVLQRIPSHKTLINCLYCI